MARQRGGTQAVPITMDDVVGAALRIVARSSLDELTVRAVALECGVTAPAVHYHLRGTAGLNDRVVEAVAASIDTRIDTSADWPEQYIAMVLAMDTAFLRYPGTGLHALTAVGPSEAATRLTTAALDILRRGGLSEHDAVEIFTATYVMFVGWLATRGRAESGAIHPALAAAHGERATLVGSERLAAMLRPLLVRPTPNA